MKKNNEKLHFNLKFSYICKIKNRKRAHFVLSNLHLRNNDNTKCAINKANINN